MRAGKSGHGDGHSYKGWCGSDMREMEGGRGEGRISNFQSHRKHVIESKEVTYSPKDAKGWRRVMRIQS